MLSARHDERPALLTERARAKINLTLTVHGRQPDGFHALESLVVFAEVADELTLRPGVPSALDVSGPFASHITGENLISRLFELVTAEHPTVRLGAVALTKNLPVASGIGGGSADVAAAIRLLARANPEAVVDWAALGARLGSDVPVCLASTPCIMHGRGENLLPVSGLPVLHLVLASPLAPVLTDKTARVFRALQAPAIAVPVPPALPDALPGVAGHHAGLLQLLTQTGNGLAAAALSVSPAAAEVLTRLAALPGSQYSALSGAGPTGFGVFPSAAAAEAAADTLRVEHPTWWIEATLCRHTGEGSG